MKKNRLFDLCAAQAARIRRGFARFSAVAVCTAAAYLLILLELFGKGPLAPGVWFACGMAGCVWAAATALVLRLACERRAWPGWLPWAGGLTAGVLAAWCWHACESGGAARWGNYWSLVYAGLLAAAVFLACWLLCGPENETGLFAHLVKSAVFSAAVALVIMLGLWICLLAADVLLVTVADTVLLAAMSLPWVLLAPNLFCAELPAWNEPVETPRAYRAIVAGAALPVYLLLVAVLYGYILKILFAWDMPSGRMNWYASFALAAYLFFWLGLRMVENRAVRLFVRWGWVLLLPIVAVQLVGIGIRLSAYGLTMWRALGLVCLGLGLLGLALAARGRGTRALYLAGAIAAVVFTVTPLNVCDLACRDQAARLERALTQYAMWDGTAIFPASGALPDEAQQDIRSSWRYLRQNGPALYRSALQEQAAAVSAGAFAEQFGFSTGEADYGTVEYESYSLMAPGAVDISGYGRLYALSEVLSLEGDACILRCQWEDGTAVEADLSLYIADLTARYAVSETLAPADARYLLPDGSTLYFTEVYVSTRDGVPDYVWCQGFLLLPTP